MALPTAHSLARIELFKNLDREALHHLEDSCSWVNVAAKEWVLDHQGDGTDLFFVLRGHLQVVVSVAGRDTILRDIRTGEYFGELAALDRQPRSAGIVAVTTATLARMPAPVFRRAIQEHNAVCDRVIAVLVRQIRSLTDRANETTGLKMKYRLIAELLRMANPEQPGVGETILSPPPTHADLAARVASHRETVTKELGVLERAGLIGRRPGAIVLLAPGRLRRMVADASKG